MKKYVIFDLDGTLIDTEKYYRIAWPKAAEKFGYHLTDEMALSLRSLGRPHAPKRFREWFGEDCDYAKIRQCRKKIMADLIEENGLQLRPGAEELLRYLKDAGVTVAIATASEYARTEQYLKEIGIFAYFDRIICADMVKEGKPSPDTYAYAANALEANREDCYAVEDSPNGVMSAYRAGCRVIYVPDQTPMEPALAPYVYAVAENLLQIRNILEL